MSLTHRIVPYHFIDGIASDPPVPGENGFLATLDIHQARRMYERTISFEEKQELSATARGFLEKAGYKPSRGYGALRFALKDNRASCLLSRCSFPARGNEGVFSLQLDYEEKLRWGEGKPLIYSTIGDLTTQEADALKEMFKAWYKKFRI